MVTGKPEHGGPRALLSWSLFPTVCGQDCWRRAVSSSSKLQGDGLCDENCFRYLWSTPRVSRLGEDQSIVDPPYHRGFCFKVAGAVLLWVTPASHQSPADCSSVHLKKKKKVQACFSVLFFQFFPSERLELEAGGNCVAPGAECGQERERESE